MGDKALFIGIDVGTSGVRAMAVGVEGAIRAEAVRPLDSIRDASRGAHEQHAVDWWAAVSSAVREVNVRIRSERFPGPAAVAITSTSGTLVVAGRNGCPLRPAMMYDDGRSAPDAETLNAACGEAGSRWNASHSLSKALWVRRNEPDIWRNAQYLLHPADWLAGVLSGGFGCSDYSNALKLGYEPERFGWAEGVLRSEIPPRLFPKVVAPGTPIGVVSEAAAAETGLRQGTVVVAGATDGVASLIASGASRPGDGNTTLGSTLVWKVLTTVKPAAGHGIYCHLHPSGLWAPGAASNTGPGAVRDELPGTDPAEKDRLAALHLPSGVMCYPLPAVGERFPFLNRDATPFFDVPPGAAAECRAAQLQALAFIERWGYELIEAGGVALGDVVYSAGAAARSPVLSALRANVLGRKVVRCCSPTAAFGAAVLAASTIQYRGDICQAIRAMTRVAESWQPDPALREPYDGLYATFREACRKRGYDS